MDTTQKLYLDNVMRLTQTITIKFPMAATLRNAYLKALGYAVDEDQPATWAYHMNLAGLYHASDEMMTVVSLDTLETIEFTYDNLLLHRATRKAYAYGSEYYNELLNRYPNQEVLIRGILSPVDITTVVKAAPWTILNYESELVEPQEVYFIQDLQRWINAFTERWYMPLPAHVQVQYPATFFGILFLHMYGEILNLRNRYVNTPHVHSYHLWAYLGSHGRLHNFKDYATLKQALYLYRNIEYIETHAGKTGTFVDLIANILTDRRIPLTAYELQHDVSAIPEAVRAKGTVAKIPQNNLAESVTGIQYIDIPEALSNEVNAAKDNAIYLESQQQEVPEKAKNTITNVLPTKVLESVMVDQSDAMPRKLADTLLSEWIYLATNNKYVANVVIADPISQEGMSMSVREALVLWIYAVMQQFEMPLTTIPDVTAFFAQRIPSPTFSELRNCTTAENVSELGIQLAMTEVTDVSTIISTEAFYSVAASIHGNIAAHRLMYTSQEDFHRRGEWEVLCYRFYANKRCQLMDEPTTYADWLKAKNWTLTLETPDEWASFANNIFTVATGADLRSTISVSDIHSAMIGIMTQLSSYGVQYVHETIAAPGVVLDNLSLRFGGIEAKGQGKYRVPSRVEIINQTQRPTFSPNGVPVVSMEFDVSKIVAKYRYELGWGVDFMASSEVKTTHRLPMAEIRFKGNLTKDIALDIPYTALPGLWEYQVDYRPIEEVITNLRLPGLWIYPPNPDTLLQTEILKRRLDGLSVKKVETAPKLTLDNTVLDGLWVKDVPRVQLWQLYDVALDGFEGIINPRRLVELFPSKMLAEWE